MIKFECQLPTIIEMESELKKTLSVANNRSPGARPTIPGLAWKGLSLSMTENKWSKFGKGDRGTL